jgi:hypothetical protein
MQGEDVNRLDLWHQMAERLSVEATRRGGQADANDDAISLYPPQDFGEPVRVLRYIDQTGTDQTVMMESGFAFKVAESLNDTDDIEYVVRTVVAILDGHATEVAEIGADGAWLHHGSTISTPTISVGMKRRAPAWRLKDVPVEHKHVRQIDPWPRASGT